MNAGPPLLLIRVALEQAALAIVLAGSAEDEARLRAWLANPAAKRRVLAAVEAALDRLAERRAA